MFTVTYYYEVNGGWKSAHTSDTLRFVPFFGLKFMTTGANYEVVDVVYDPEEDKFDVYLKQI